MMIQIYNAQTTKKIWKYLFVATVLLMWWPVQAQVTLDSCRLWAKANYPAIEQYDLLRQSAEYSVSNAARSWIPHVTLSGAVSYQSDAANMGEMWEAMGLDAMLAATGREMPEMYMRKLQGKVQVDVQQTLWDGGHSAAERELALASQREEEAQTDVDFYQLDNRVMQLYFGILLIDEQERQLASTDSVLRSNLERVRTMLANEAALQSDVDAVEVELLVLGQTRLQLASSRTAYRRMLSLMVGRNMAEEAFLIPAGNGVALESVADAAAIDRPELRLMEARSSHIEAQRTMLRTATMPQFSAFAQGWYGYPTLNMFEAMQSGRWDLSGIVGIRMQWNISAFYTQKNRLAQLDVVQKRKDLQREVFLYNRRLQQTQKRAEVTRLSEVLRSDDRIVQLRGSVRRAAESKYAAGTITTAELLKAIADESTALSSATLHRIELIQAQYELNKL